MVYSRCKRLIDDFLMSKLVIIYKKIIEQDSVDILYEKTPRHVEVVAEAWFFARGAFFSDVDRIGRSAWVADSFLLQIKM